MSEQSLEQVAPTIPSFDDAIKTCFRKYCRCKGRASRSEFWYFFLFVRGVEAALAVVAFALLIPAFVSKVVTDNSEQFFVVQETKIEEDSEHNESPESTREKNIGDSAPSVASVVSVETEKSVDDTDDNNTIALKLPLGQIVEIKGEKTVATQEELQRTLSVLKKVALYGGLSGLALLAFLGVFELVVFLPCVAVTVRRLHDVNLTGWLWLLDLTQVGRLANLIICAIPPTGGNNRFGSEPVKP